VTLRSLAIQRVEDFKDAFDRAAREGLHGVVILSSPLINAQRSQITSLALKMRLPTISLFTLFPRSGGLMAYGPNLPDMYKRAVTYINKLLKGTKVGDLPIERPSRFEFVVNVKTAKALGLTIPPVYPVPGRRGDPVGSDMEAARCRGSSMQDNTEVGVEAWGGHPPPDTRAGSETHEWARAGTLHAPSHEASPAEPRHAGDGIQRPLRSRFQPRLMPGAQHYTFLESIDPPMGF
jgi:hypothetical protein